MKKYLTVHEAAIMAHVNCRTIRRWVTSRRINGLKRGNHIIIDAPAFQTFLDHRAKTRSKCSISINVNISIDLKSLRSAFNLLKEALQS